MTRLRGFIRRPPPWALALALLALGGCASEAGVAEVIPGADPGRGEALMRAYGCPSCHTIPGVLDARGMVGPPLTLWARRDFIAGALPNRPGNLIRWIMDPQAIEPGTVMPDLGVSETEARDIAAYLYTLR
jgi:cytochrome c